MQGLCSVFNCFFEVKIGRIVFIYIFVYKLDMKKTGLILSVAAIACSALMFSACDDLKSKLFKAFTTNKFEMDFTIPVQSTIGTKGDVGSVVQNYNLDSLISAETGGAFGLDDIKSVELKTIEVVILNPDATNNLANFEEGWCVFSSDQNMTPIGIATGLIPDTYADSYVMTPVPGINLKDYMTGKVYTYVMQSKLRRATTKALNCKLKVAFQIN